MYKIIEYLKYNAIWLFLFLFYEQLIGDNTTVRMIVLITSFVVMIALLIIEEFYFEKRVKEIEEKRKESLK